MPAKYNWTRESLSRVAPRAGLYTIYGYVPGHRMYHGKSNDLRRRLLEHYRSDDIGFFPAYVVVTYVANWMERARREEERIVRDEPTYNIRYKRRSPW
jgi:predicted GIY-YIG superfamily endonuclease